MEGHDFLDVELPLVEPLLVGGALRHLEQNMFEGLDARVLFFLGNPRLHQGLLLLDADVIAFDLLLKVLGIQILDGVEHVDPDVF